MGSVGEDERQALMDDFKASAEGATVGADGVPVVIASVDAAAAAAGNDRIVTWCSIVWRRTIQVTMVHGIASSGVERFR